MRGLDVIEEHGFSRNARPRMDQRASCATYITQHAEPAHEPVKASM